MEDFYERHWLKQISIDEFYVLPLLKQIPIDEFYVLPLLKQISFGIFMANDRIKIFQRKNLLKENLNK